MISLFVASGYEKILVAIWDQELGDNEWASKNSKTLSVPHTDSLYKESDGNYMFENGFIGKTPHTPHGTPFEYISFARVNKNVLFVTVDAFYQISKTLFFDRREGGLLIVPCLGFEAAQKEDTITCKLVLHGTLEFVVDGFDTGT